VDELTKKINIIAMSTLMFRFLSNYKAKICVRSEFVKTSYSGR